MEYSKGKWEVSRGPMGWIVEIEKMPDAPNKVVCACNTEDDAHLIAAAPDMYEALKELSRLLPPRTPEDSRLILKAEQALARAEGK